MYSVRSASIHGGLDLLVFKLDAAHVIAPWHTMLARLIYKQLDQRWLCIVRGSPFFVF
jgi:hypothetical protein